MRLGRQGRALAGFEIHHVVARRAAPERERRLPRLAQRGEIDAEAAVGPFRSRHGLEDEVHRRAQLDGADRVRHMRQHAGLGRDLVAFAQRIQHPQQLHRVAHAVRRRVDADHRVARTVQQPVQHRDGDAARVVGRVVGLQPAGQAPRQADRVAEGRHHPAFPRHGDQVLVAHQLRHRRHHLRRQPRGQRGQRRRIRLVRQQPVAEIPHRPVRDRCEGGCIMRVEDQPRHLVRLVGHHRFGQEGLQRQFRQHPARRHAFRIRPGGDPGQLVARAPGCRGRQQVPQILEAVAFSARQPGPARHPPASSRPNPASTAGAMPGGKRFPCPEGFRPWPGGLPGAAPARGTARESRGGRLDRGRSRSFDARPERAVIREPGAGDG